jgi:hypothetical protein
MCRSIGTPSCVTPAKTLLIPIRFPVRLSLRRLPALRTARAAGGLILGVSYLCQKYSLTANWKRRGSPAVVIRPKLAALLEPETPPDSAEVTPIPAEPWAAKLV